MVVVRGSVGLAWVRWVTLARLMTGRLWEIVGDGSEGRQGRGGVGI